MPTLIEEMKSVILVKYEFEYGEKLKLKCFLWKIRTIKTLMPEGKTMKFRLITCLKMLFFRLRFWTRNSNWWWFKVKSLDVERNQNDQHFLENFKCHESNAWIKTKALLFELFLKNRKVEWTLGLEE